MALRATRQMVEVLSTSDSGKTRVTRQSAAVVAAGVGKVRVFRQMIEVLASEPAAEVYEVTASNAISLTSTLHVTPMQVSASSTIATTGTAIKEFTRQRYAESIIVLTQDADIKNEAISVITVTQDVSVLRIANKLTTSAIAASQTATRTAAFKRTATSPITVTQEAIYHGPISASALTTLSLTSSTRKCDTLLASAQSVLSAANTAVASGTIRVYAYNELALSSLADRGVFNRTASNELILTQSASPDYYYTAFSVIELASTGVQGQVFGNAVSTLTLTQIARSNPLTAGPGPEYDFLLPATVIALQQRATSSIRMMTAESTLTLTDAVGVLRPWYVTAESEVQTVTQVFDPVTNTMVDVIAGLSDLVVVTKKNVTPFTVHQYLQLVSQANVVKVKTGAISASAESVLSLDYDLYINRTGLAVSHLELSVSADIHRCTPATSLIELSDLAAANHVGLRDAHSHLGMGHSLVFSVIRVSIPRRVHDQRLYTYCPSIGEGDPDAPTPPPSTLAGPIPGVTVPFQLVYPATGGVSDCVTLHTPNFGNKDRLSFNRIVRETRGGTLVVYADPIWPKIQTLVLSFSGLTTSEKNELLEFMDTHLGQEIGVYDWEHRYWRGVIVVPSDPAVQDDRNSFSVSFEFEGEMV